MITYHPFGSRGYKNLQIWDQTQRECDWRNVMTHRATVLMNDQEPIYLDHIYDWKNQHHEHVNQTPFGVVTNAHMRKEHGISYDAFPEDVAKWQAEKHLRQDPIEYYDQTLTPIQWVARYMMQGTLKPIIVHSELRSPQVKELSTEFIPVYVFWHGLIARDWYRAYRHVPACQPNISRANGKRFLLYAREYTGSRSYREHFVKQLITNHLAPAFQYHNYPDEPCLHKHFKQPQKTPAYTRHDWARELIDNKFKILKHVKNDHVSSDSSVNINTDDYNSTAIQIVAETVFENQRIHLTEKTFQPIVAGQPFVTLSAPGTLEILRYYGFQTFDHVWDESYDKIKDPAERMSAVIDVIKYLNKHDKFKELYEKCMPVCEHNRNHFFSTRFESQMLSEYDHNWRSAFDQQQRAMKMDPGGACFWTQNHTLKIHNTDKNYKIDERYCLWHLHQIRHFSEEQYQLILKQYDWAREMTQSH